MSTVEAIQARLGDIYVLWPGTPENPPKFIRDEDIFYENPRSFSKPNESGQIFEYEYDAPGKRWCLKND